MTGSIAPNRPGHHGTVVARTVGTVAISCNDRNNSYLGNGEHDLGAFLVIMCWQNVELLGEVPE